MDNIIIEVIKYCAVFLTGSFVHWIFLQGKISKLTLQIEELIDTVKQLENRYDNIEQMRYQLYDSEKRISSLEARLDLAEQQIKYISQDID